MKEPAGTLTFTADDSKRLFAVAFPSRAAPVNVLTKIGEVKSSAVTAVQPVSAVSSDVIAVLKILYQKVTICAAGVVAAPSLHCSPVYERVVMMAGDEDEF